MEESEIARGGVGTTEGKYVREVANGLKRFGSVDEINEMSCRFTGIEIVRRSRSFVAESSSFLFLFLVVLWLELVRSAVIPIELGSGYGFRRTKIDPIPISSYMRRSAYAHVDEKHLQPHGLESDLLLAFV